MSENQLMITHDITISLPRTNNIPLMQLFYDKGARGPQQLALNQCRLYLKAFHLSDITDFSRNHITEAAWQGTPSRTLTNSFNWPH